MGILRSGVQAVNIVSTKDATLARPTLIWDRAEPSIFGRSVLVGYSQTIPKV